MYSLYSLLETDMAPARKKKDINPCIQGTSLEHFLSQRNEVWMWMDLSDSDTHLSTWVKYWFVSIFIRSFTGFFTFYWVHIGQCASVAGSLFITLLARRGKLGFRVTATPGPFRWRWRRGKSEMQPRIHPWEILLKVCWWFAYFSIFWWMDICCCVHSHLYFSQTHPYIFPKKVTPCCQPPTALHPRWGLLVYRTERRSWAEAAGLQRGDQLVKVSGVDAKLLRLWQASKKTRGKIHPKLKI